MARPSHPARPRRTRARRTLGAAALAATGVAVLSGPTTGAGHPVDHTSTAVSGGIAVLRQELDAMTTAGLPADHPKVRMLQEDLTALEQGIHTTVATEAGIDVPARIAAATRDAGGAGTGGARAVDSTGEATLDDGRVDCEPLPGLLTAAEVEGARCSSTLQADGGSLYVAETPGGTRHTVRFAPDGTVTRAS